MDEKGLELFPVEDIKKSAKKYIKENKNMMLLLLILVAVAPFLYMNSMGYSAMTIVFYYIAGLIVIFFLAKMVVGMFQQKKDTTRKGMLDRRARAQQAIDDIDAKFEEEAEFHRGKLKEINRLNKSPKKSPKKIPKETSSDGK